MLGQSPRVRELQLSELPESVHAEHAWSEVSDKYSFLPTVEVVKALGEHGIVPYLAKQSRTRIEGKAGFTKHLIRFRELGAVAIVGDVFPEIVLTNSHDRASSFQIDMGLFRLVCSNGLVVSHGNLGSYRIRHVGSTIEDVLRASQAVIQQFPRVSESVQLMQAHQLTDAQRLYMAELAMGLRWEADKLPFQPSTLLSTRRTEDGGHDLWTTYNVIQENMLRGQSMRYRGRFYNNERPKSTREVKSIDMEMSINRGLWEMASTFVNT